MKIRYTPFSERMVIDQPVKGMDFANPHFDMLSFYKDLGGKLVAVGSDAHIAGNIGFGFDKAAQLIEHFNFKNINE